MGQLPVVLTENIKYYVIITPRLKLQILIKQLCHRLPDYTDVQNAGTTEKRCIYSSQTNFFIKTHWTRMRPTWTRIETKRRGNPAAAVQTQRMLPYLSLRAVIDYLINQEKQRPKFVLQPSSLDAWSHVAPLFLQSMPGGFLSSLVTNF